MRPACLGAHPGRPGTSAVWRRSGAAGYGDAMPTLYLNGHLTEARLDGRCIEVSRAETAKDTVVSMRVPFYDLERVVVIGQAGLTTPLLQKLATEGIPLHLLSGHGRWLGALYPNANGHALRRLRQYELARNGHFSLGFTAAAVVAKLRNSRRVLQRLAASRFDRLRRYFPEQAPFNGRNRRPPRDAANALLSWTYTIVLSEIAAAVRAAHRFPTGDPRAGQCRASRHGRPRGDKLLHHAMSNPDPDGWHEAIEWHNADQAGVTEFHPGPEAREVHPMFYLVAYDIADPSRLVSTSVAGPCWRGGGA